MRGICHAICILMLTGLRNTKGPRFLEFGTDNSVPATSVAELRNIELLQNQGTFDLRNSVLPQLLF